MCLPSVLRNLYVILCEVIFFNGVEGMDGLSVETEGDLSTGISCYFFRVTSLCPLVLPNFQKAWGSRRIKTVCPCQCPEGR